MPKTDLWRLGQGEIFKFNEKSFEYAVVSLSGNFVKCKNLSTGVVIDVNKFYKVFTPPYEIFKQLSLF